MDLDIENPTCDTALWSPHCILITVHGLPFLTLVLLMRDQVVVYLKLSYVQLKHHASREKAQLPHLKVDVASLKQQGFWKLLGTLTSNNEDDTVSLQRTVNIPRSTRQHGF